MGSGTYERQGNYLSTGSSGGYEFVRFPRGEIWHDGGDPNKSDGYAELYFEVGFFVNAGNFYGANFKADGSSVDSFQVYGAGEYNVDRFTIQVPWNGYRHFWEKSYYTSYSSGYHESIVEFDWYPTLPTYTIQYNANGGQGAPSNQTKEYGTAVTLSTSIPTRENYNFVGWATSSTATSAAYQAGDSYTANAAVKLYAVWELAFLPPTSVLTAYRVQAGTTTRYAEGTEVYATVDWAANPIDSTDIVTVTGVTASITEDGAAVSPTITWGGTRTGASGQATIRFAANTANSYVLTVTVTDSNGLSTVKSATIANIKYPIYVSHDTTNNVDTVKIENLELGQPLASEFVEGGTVLFDNDSQAMSGDITLSQSALNFARLLVICKDNDGIYTSVSVVPALNRKFSAMTVYPGGGGFWIKAKVFVLASANYIQCAYGGSDYMRGEVNAAGSNATNDTDRLNIVKVIGFKN